MRTFSKTLLCATLLALALIVPARAEEPKPEIIETLTVGAITYTNVQILQRTKSDVFIRHGGGAVNVKIKDLDKSTQLQLGYSLADPVTNAAPARATLPEIELDPRYREIAEQIVWESQEFLKTLDHRVLYGAAGGAFLLYLFFCWCCSLIARKAGLESAGLAWLPLFKQVPLLRAAGMSPWWMITNLLPPIFAITYIVWCFKIARARGKSPMTGCLLLLPVINIFAFLYLAFADRLQRYDDYGNSGKVLSFQQGPRRAA